LIFEFVIGFLVGTGLAPARKFPILLRKRVWVRGKSSDSHLPAGRQGLSLQKTLWDELE